eukprot:GFUD01028823.1.p1 GENE.GFUD01028823.1~~GFUD01028823.1.p1  ORF type:complete len:373 (-),score=60.05 GFUD01028823.1:194-1312(-)
MSLDLVLLILLFLPLIPYICCGFALFLCLPLYLTWKMFFKLIGYNPCNSQIYSNLKIFWETAWKLIKHPRIMLQALKKVLWNMKEKTSKIDKTEIFTIDIPKKHKQPKVKADSILYFTILLYYAAVFTLSFWIRHVYFLCLNITPDVTAMIIFIICYIVLFIPFCFLFLAIPSANHLSESEAVEYLTGSPACGGYLRIECYHTEGSGEDSTRVTTYQTDITVPVARWIDLAKPNPEQLSADIHKLLSKISFLLLTPILHVTPADDDCKNEMDKLRKDNIDSNKHRDSEISATFFYKLVRNGRQVDNLVVFTEGTTVPGYWLTRGPFCLLVFFLAIGFPLAAVAILIWKINTWKLIFKKQIHLSNTGGCRLRD